ncbi:follistatin [Caerostris extrusa]|uniref:Follistatin n=1 Tax=Caerostris extrusa TaxID=172846 RepID=A0AAV4UB61_CAEEX|nr:follistatin [Caerostris extrusa]
MSMASAEKRSSQSALIYVAPSLTRSGCFPADVWESGQCWSMMSRPDKCTESLRTNVTQEECCSDGSATTAWSPKDLTPGDLFFWMSLEGASHAKHVKCLAKA